jgi:hypothetical protein
VPRERLASDLTEPGQHAEDTIRDSGLRGECSDPDRRQRRFLRRLQDERVSGGERRSDLPGRHDEREIPRHDRRDHADGLAGDHRKRIRARWRDLVVDLVDGFRVPGDAARRGRDVDRETVGDRLAHVECLEQRELVAVQKQQLRELEQHLLA